MIAGLGLLAFTGYQAMTCKHTQTACKISIDFYFDAVATVDRFAMSGPYSHDNADRENLRLAQQEFQGLPASLLWLLAVSTAISIVGGLQSSGELKAISLAHAPQ